MAETVRKIIVDSRYFAAGDPGSGVYELPEIVEIHHNQVLYLEQFSVTNTWYSVDETCNQFYLVEWTYGFLNGGGFNRYQPRILTLPTAPYDLNSFAVALENAPNGRDKMLTGTYKVSRTTNDPNTGATSIALAQNFTIVLNQPEGGLPNTATSKVTESFFPVPEKLIGDPNWYQNYWLFWEDPTRNTGARPTYDPFNPRATTNLIDFPWAVGTWHSGWAQ